MPQPGENIAHYKIISAIGTGGMGQVYLAEDTRLGRKVALKILLDAVASDTETRRRFGQEARAASALNHPNIITIYEIGQWENNDYIAMEYAEGHNVRTLLSAGRIELNDALDVGAQVASALAAAHTVGIVHRDIKPENIIRRPDGLVKVLDFGLAKQTAPAYDTGEVDSEAATYGVMLTTPGVVMGTLPYMSPEQARGKAVDTRTDIWSLGVVLYEMIRGEQPFSGETKSDLLAAILTKEPDPIEISTLHASRELENVIKKALTKDREERYQSAKDLQIDLKILRSELNSGAFKTEVLNQTTSGTRAFHTYGNAVDTGTHPASAGGKWMWPVAAVVVALAALGLWYWKKSPVPPTLTDIQTAQIASWKSALGETSLRRPRLSPNGKLVAYTALKDGRNAIWVKQLTGGGEPFTLKQDESGDTSPVWSPDGERIAYLSDRDGKKGIWSVPALGGTAQLMSNIPGGEVVLVCWATNGDIYFERSHNLYSVNPQGGEITKHTNFDENIFVDHDVDISPDEKRIAYADRVNGQSDIWVANLDGTDPVQVTNDEFMDGGPIWHPDGKRLIYTSERGGTKQLFVGYVNGSQPAQLTLADSDLTVADVSSDGRQILYVNAKDDSDIWAVNTDSGKETQLTSDIGPEFWPSVSPSGSAIVYQGVHRTSIGTNLLSSSLFLQELSPGSPPIQLASEGTVAEWSPDGKQIAFIRSDQGSQSIWVSSASGGDARRLTQTGVVMGGFGQLPFNRVRTRDMDWAPDGDSLIFVANRDQTFNIWRVNASGGSESKVTANSEKSLLIFNPVFSPDGSGIAWLGMRRTSATETEWEIWVQNGDRSEAVYRSNSALRLLGWSASGKELIVEATGGGEVQVYPASMTILEVPAAGGNAHEIASLDSAYFLNAVLAPDHKTLAFVSRGETGDAINVMPATGGTPKKLIESSDRRVYFSSLDFSQDGKTIYYGKQANWQVITSITNFK
jgi:serine/threonine protein kinase/Tol biopolymer transport system component